jgi:hypothetical protein
MQDVKFSQRLPWRVLSSGTKRPLVRWKSTDVKEKHYDSFFRVKKYNHKAEFFLELKDFRTSSIVRILKNQKIKTRRFGNWMFPSSGEGRHLLCWVRTKPENLLILRVIHHRQNPRELFFLLTWHWFLAGFSSSETSVEFQWTTQRYILEDNSAGYILVMLVWHKMKVSLSSFYKKGNQKSPFANRYRLLGCQSPFSWYFKNIV